MAGGAPDALDLRCTRQDLRGDFLGMLRKHGRRWHMAGEASLAFFRRRIRLQPHAQHGTKHRRLQGGAVEKRSIHAAERFQIRRLFPRALPFFVMAVVALLALFGADEHLFDLVDPAIRRLPVGLLRDRSLLVGGDAEEKQYDTSCGYPSFGQHSSKPHRT